MAARRTGSCAFISSSCHPDAPLDAGVTEEPDGAVVFGNGSRLGRWRRRRQRRGAGTRPRRRPAARPVVARSAISTRDGAPWSLALGANPRARLVAPARPPRHVNRGKPSDRSARTGACTPFSGLAALALASSRLAACTGGSHGAVSPAVPSTTAPPPAPAAPPPQFPPEWPYPPGAPATHAARGHGRDRQRDRHEGGRRRARDWRQRRRRRRRDGLRARRRVSRRQATSAAAASSSRASPASRTRSTSARRRPPRRRATCTWAPTASPRASRARAGARWASPGASRACGRRGTRSGRRTRRGPSCSRRPSTWPNAASSSTPRSTEGIGYLKERLAKFPASAALFLPNGAPPPVGTTWRDPELATVLRLIAAQGPAGFYEGPVAEARRARDEGKRRPRHAGRPRRRTAPGGARRSSTSTAGGTSSACRRRRRVA